MHLLLVVVLAFLIGVVCGLRSMTAPAVVAWAAHLSWLNLHDSPLSFMGSTAAVAIFTALALGELAVDKNPSIPSRTILGSMLVRVILGGLSGAAIAISGAQPGAIGAVAGVIGAICGAFGGYHARRSLVQALKSPDWVIAIVEDIVAIGGGLLIVSRI